jgi:hypothetical protein
MMPTLAALMLPVLGGEPGRAGDQAVRLAMPGSRSHSISPFRARCSGSVVLEK